jgi:hypothetical protein
MRRAWPDATPVLAILREYIVTAWSTLKAPSPVLHSRQTMAQVTP